MSLFSQYFTISIGIHKYTGTNSYGDAQYSPTLEQDPIPFLCRIEFKFKEILDKDGNKVTSEAQLYTDALLNPMDIVVFNNKQYAVQSCSPIADLRGNLDHYEAYL